METVIIKKMIGHEIVRIDYCIDENNAILFKLKNGPEILMKMARQNQYNADTISTKNRQPINIMDIENVKIRDIDWYGSFRDIDGLMIISEDNDIYRIECKKKDGISKNALYNYTKYKVLGDKKYRKRKSSKNQYNYISV